MYHMFICLCFRVGSSEKGYLSLELSVRSPGGHSSMPHQTSSIGILSQALIRFDVIPTCYVSGVICL